MAVGNVFTRSLGRAPAQAQAQAQAHVPCRNQPRPQPLAHKQAARYNGAWPSTPRPDEPGPGSWIRCAAYKRGTAVTQLCDQGYLTQAVEALGLLVQTQCCISKSLFSAVLKKCAFQKDLVLGRRVHAFTVKTGYQSDTILGTNILRMYASHGRLQDAMGVFELVSEPDAFTWSAIISAHAKQGQDKLAIELYHRMRRSSVRPDGHVFVAVLQACARGSDLKTGQQVHAHVLAAGTQPDLFVTTCLVNMYAKCGTLEDAHRLFDGLGHNQKHVVTWTALIAGYSQQGRGQEALRVYGAMQQDGLAVPNSVTFVCLLQACASVGTPALEKGKQLHVQIRDHGYQDDVFVANSLVNMYAKCGSLEDAHGLFHGLGQKDVGTWNALIAGYVHHGRGQEALRLYDVMKHEGITTPDSMTFVCLLQACATVGTPALVKGRQLHVELREGGPEADVFLANNLVNMYAKCGSIEDAQNVFDGLHQKDVVTWNAMIAGYCQQGMGQEALRVFSDMQEEAIAPPNSVTFLCVLQACASVGSAALEKGREVHAQIRECVHQSDSFVANSLVNMYAKCGSLDDAQRVFDGLVRKDVVMWTALIAGYSQQDMGHKALHLYSAMQEEGTAVPNSMTFVSLLQACASVGTPALDKGKQIHMQIREQGYEADLLVANSLVNMYAKCGSLEDAHTVFDGLGEKDVVTWTALIAGYSQQSMSQEALHLYSAMQEDGMAVPNSMTFGYLLQACASLGTPALEKGRQLHAEIRARGHQADLFVANSLVNMYVKCGSLEAAHRVFDGLVEKDVVTWTALIAGYSRHGMGQEALRQYIAMQEEGITVPDPVTFVCLLQACANVAALHLGRQIHAQIEEQGLHHHVFLASSLINMYGKAGSMVDAQQVFDGLPHREIVAWSALIAGYTSQGHSEVVFDLVQRMKEDGVQPVGVTFLSVLTVCSHAGLVTKGMEFFEAMSIEYGITRTVEHYTCMVDLLGRAGRLDEALKLVRKMPLVANAAIWHTLLNACRKWRNLEVARHAFNEAVKLDQKDAAAFVLMFNIYTGAQMWEQAQKMQLRRLKVRAWKQPGQTWWTDMEGEVHSFLVGDDKLKPGWNRSFAK